jgi:hypothetical protein
MALVLYFPVALCQQPAYHKVVARALSPRYTSGGFNTVPAVETTMSKERKPATATVKIDPELLRKAKQHCALNDLKLSDYLDGLVRAHIDRDHAKTLRKIAQDHRDELEP